MSEKSIVEKIEIKTLKASSGTLSVFEKKISFERAYWIEAVKGKNEVSCEIYRKQCFV